jgi:hypothetical protein
VEWILNSISIMDTGSIPVWLAVIAVVQVVQLAGIAVAAIVVTRQAAKAAESLASLSAEIRPIIRRTNTVLDDMQDLAGRARRADEAAHAAAERVQTAWTAAKTIARSRLWPVIGAARAAQAVVRAIARRTQRADRDAEDRFTYEGGSHAVE